MRVDLDFSDDKAKVLAALSAYTSSEGQGFDLGTEGSAEGGAETGGAFTADDTDYNTFTADRKLLALQSLMQALGKISQKKSIIYFSNGISQSGTDNQSALRATIDEIDSAIGEARDALARQPGDEWSQESLLDALGSKVALLQDTVALLGEFDERSEERNP